MKRLFSIKYPKIFLLTLTIILAYLLFSQTSITKYLQETTENQGYFLIFIGGLLFSLGFTTPFSIGLFLSLSPNNLFLASIIGGAGALISDLFIFKIIKISFLNEFKELEKTILMKEIFKETHKIPRKIKHYLLYIFAGIIIASPLPDEFGITMLAGLSTIKTIPLSILSFTFNTLGILILLIL